ncbi:DnaJ domain-containing protein [Saccharibacter sp. 17.LH.SD]|uniref:TerB family tellurite resistance protein n=1 Tax=Saccharibacter sp. 17.LH.SD TaxID=2689393 RepID=UPI00136C781D|nr:TerB family tellurite resistance protein [Saccharibacter sp. 17.LH.SD]MXV44903.1 DnaJ domain-containing protein [Saccharibacter sp. 17.LH.SD]
MAFWGKMFGGTAGFAVGGPFGSLMGLALGHLADKKQLLTPPSGSWGTHFDANGRPDPNNAAFFTAAKIASVLGKRDQLYGLGLIALCAKLAKIDGPVQKSEINTFKLLFRFPEESMREVGLMFDRSRERTDDFEMYAREMGKAFSDKPEPLETLLSALFRIARADLPPGAPLHPAEDDFLRRVHKAFRLSARAWDRAESGQASSTGSDTPDAYRVLGIARSATDQDVKQRWRILIREYHPDVLARRPMTAAQRLAAQERIAQINAAWDRIKRDRGL